MRPALLRRQEAELPPVIRFFDLMLSTAERRARRGMRDIHLTPIEYEVPIKLPEDLRRTLTRMIQKMHGTGYILRKEASYPSGSDWSSGIAA